MTNKSSENKSQLSLLIVGMIICLLMVILGLFWIYSPKEVASNKVAKVTASPAPKTSPVPEVPAAGLTYISPDKKISFSYPQGWYLLEYKAAQNNNLVTVMLDDKENANQGPSYVAPISLGYNVCGTAPCHKSIDDFLKDELPALDGTVTTVTDIMVDNHPVKLVKGRYASDAGPLANSFKKAAYIELPGAYYFYVNTGDETFEGAFDEILSTIKISE